MDWLMELGSLGFASRLKRLSDRLYRDVARIYEDLETEMLPRWFPLLYLLSHRAPLAITEIAEELGLTHPAVNQIAGTLEDRGYIRSKRARSDERRRILSLTQKGRLLTEDLEPAWQVIQSRTDELIRSTGIDLLSALDRIEESLDGEDMYSRIVGSIPELRAARVEIVEYRPAYKKWFLKLNLEWIQEEFEVEPEDERVLSDPGGLIVKKGGKILFAKLRDRIVGTAALIRLNESEFELAKLAVTKKERGRGIGRALIREAIDLAGNLGASRILLNTSPVLKDANRLYRSFGFRRDRSRRLTEHSYKRATVRFVLNL